jgi:hypothetical protein
MLEHVRCYAPASDDPDTHLHTAQGRPPKPTQNPRRSMTTVLTVSLSSSDGRCDFGELRLLAQHGGQLKPYATLQELHCTTQNKIPQATRHRAYRVPVII